MPADRNSLEIVAREVIPADAILAHLGTGGFACTFKVTGDGDAYALKIIDPGLSEAARVERELGALRRVDHSGVVRFIEHGDHEHNGITYKWIKMAFVEGHSLRQALVGGQVFDVAEALQLVRALVDAASAIWDQRTAHRDLSPGNILLLPDNRPVIVDLGLARHVDDETLTELPTPGTPGWMSPEQVKSSPTHGDWRSDQFVIGALGYLFLTNVQPFFAPSLPDRWMAPARQTPTPIRVVDPSIPSAAADVIERMLQKQPHRRYLRPGDILADLDRAIAAVQHAPATPTLPQHFFLNVSTVKNFAEDGGVAVVAPDGVIVDIRAGKRVDEFVDAARAIGATTVIDPVTHFARSPEVARPKQVLRLPYGAAPKLTGFSDDEARTSFCENVLDLQMQSRPDAVIAPYFYAGEGEGGWITESLACAAKFEELMAERAADDRADVWASVAVHSSWLADNDARDTLLTELTGQPMSKLYLLVATAQGSFAPLGDLPVLAGIHDLLAVLREAGVPVVAGKRASSGLLLLALGAAGWGTGVSGNLMNMSPHPEDESDRGSRLDRIYVPRLLNSVAVDTYVLMRRQKPHLVAVDTPQADALFRANRDLENLTKEQRILLIQHNLVAQRQQVEALASLAAGDRIGALRDQVEVATATYRELPPPRIVGDGDSFLAAWAAVLA